MRRMLGFVIFIVLCLYPYLARGDTNPPVPDIRGWTVVNISRIEVRVSDDIVAYLGLDVAYVNPADPRESVRVIRRHIPIILNKHRPQDEHLFSEAMIASYSQKEENDRLMEVSKKSDPIAYVQWRTKKNPRTGKDMQDGDVDIWFMPAEGILPDGSWLFFKNEKMKVGFLTENVGNGKLHNVFSGMEYQVGDVYHILRVSRGDFMQLFKGGK